MGKRSPPLVEGPRVYPEVPDHERAAGVVVIDDL
jgi:hypothetical protein